MTFPYQLICFDNDGTLSVSGRPIGDIVPRLVRLHHEQGTRLMMITNNSSKDDLTYQKKLHDMGFSPGSVEIISPVAVASGIFKARHFTRGYILGNPLCIGEFARRGIAHVEDHPQFVHVAYDTTLTYEKLAHACRLVKQGVPLYQSHIDPVCPGIETDLPDCGLMIDLISVPTGVKPAAVFGKESEHYAAYLAARVKPNERAVIVGDRLRTDIALGARLGWDSVWINAAGAAPSGEIKPNYSFARFTDFLDRMA